MTAKSLINLILKILGLFFITNVLDALSRLISVLVYFPQYDTTRQAWYNLGVTLPSLILYSIFVFLLIFRTNSLINLFRLDRGSGSEPVVLRVHRSVILGIAVIAAGLWLIVSGTPEFVRQMAYYYQERKLYVRMAHPDVSYLAMSMAKLLLGLILIVFNRSLVNLIEFKRQAPWYWPARVPLQKRKKKMV